jgi:hypothetical protein
MHYALFLAHAGHEHPELSTMTPWWRDQTTLFIVVAAGFVLLFSIAFYLQRRRNADKKRTPEE